jgi:hypothetical protein
MIRDVEPRIVKVRSGRFALDERLLRLIPPSVKPC